MKTLQDQYKLILEGKGNKTMFLSQARRLFPNYFNQYTDYRTAVKVLKGKQILNEEKEEQKDFDPLKDMPNLFNYKDKKNRDNLNFNEILKGFYAEMSDEKNKEKTKDELIEIVSKNLAGDPLFYVKDGEFGLKGVGYTNDASGSLKLPKEIKGDYKSSGMEKAKVPVNESLSLRSLLKEIVDEDPGGWTPEDDKKSEEEYENVLVVKDENKDLYNSLINLFDLYNVTYDTDGKFTIKFDDLKDQEWNEKFYKKLGDFENDFDLFVPDANKPIEEAWEGAEFDTGKFDDGPQPDSYKVKILDIKKVQQVQSIIQDLGFKMPKFGYSDIFEFEDEEALEAFTQVLDEEDIEYQVIGNNLNEESKDESTITSDCCGVEVSGEMIDMGICPGCHEYCSFVDSEGNYID